MFTIKLAPCHLRHLSPESVAFFIALVEAAMLAQSHQCAWCGRMCQDGQAYGQRLPLSAGWSHGICRECLRVQVAMLQQPAVAYR